MSFRELSVPSIGFQFWLVSSRLFLVHISVRVGRGDWRNEENNGMAAGYRKSHFPLSPIHLSPHTFLRGELATNKLLPWIVERSKFLWRTWLVVALVFIKANKKVARHCSTTFSGCSFPRFSFPCTWQPWKALLVVFRSRFLDLEISRKHHCKEEA